MVALMIGAVVLALVPFVFVLWTPTKNPREN
jgi:hypothetical protein